MKKALLTLIALSLVFGTVWAYTDSYMPKGRQAGQKFAATDQNFFYAQSPDRGTSMNAYQNITNFSYATDGKWAYALGHSELFANGEPTMVFGGGNDIENTIKVWFWSATTGLKELVSEPYVGTIYVWTSIAQADNGTLYATWCTNYYQASRSNIMITSSADSGRTWTAPVNVSTLIQAYDATDTCMMFPKLAPRAIDGLHLVWLDDSKAPGSNVQSVGAADTCFVKYAKISLALDAVMDLDNGTGSPDKVANLGWTSYDWVTTGCTQGLVIDNTQNMAAIWTRSTVFPFAAASRYIGFNSYMVGAGVGTQAEISPATAGFPGISLCKDYGNGQLPAVTYHRASAIRVLVDQGGIGGSMWTTEASPNSGANYIWPSIAHIGGANVGDSIAVVGNYGGAGYIGVRLYVTPDNFANVFTTQVTDPIWNAGTGTHNGIVANPNGPDIWVFFAGNTDITATLWAPIADTVLNTPDANHMNVITDRNGVAYYGGADSFKLYHKLNDGGSWTEIGAVDTIAFPGTVAFNVAYSTAATDTNWYYITGHDAQGWSPPSNMFRECMGVVAAGVSGTPSKPAARGFVLSQSRPNPARFSTTISFSLPRDGAYNLKVYNLMGQSVKTISGTGTAGVNTINWGLTDNNNNRVTNGIYFYQLNAGGNTATRKLTVVR